MRINRWPDLLIDDSFPGLYRDSPVEFVGQIRRFSSYPILTRCLRPHGRTGSGIPRSSILGGSRWIPRVCRPRSLC